MKIAYISSPFFADADLSLINKMKNQVDTFYFITIAPYSLNSTAINLKKQYPKAGIFSASIYKELDVFKGIVDFDKTFIINKTSSKGYAISNIILNLKLFFFLLKLKPDIIHFTSYFQYPEFIYYLLKKKIVLSIHDPFPHVGEISMRDNVYRKIAYKLISNFVIFNNSQKDDFIEKNNLEKKNVFVSRLSVYTYLKAYSKQVSVDGNYILFFGRITPYKGIEYLLPAMKMVHQNFPNIKLIIAGKGNYNIDIDEFKDCEYIEFINRYIPQEELANLIHNSKMIICPYTEATQSGVILSSFALNKPVIATNVGGISEYLQNNVTGILIESKNINAIFDAISYVFNGKVDLKTLEDNITNLMKTDKFSWEKISAELIQFYKNNSNE